MNTAEKITDYSELILANIEDESLVFSANELGKVTITIKQLKALTNFDFSNLPNENELPSKIYDMYAQYPELDFLPIRNSDNWIVGYFTRKSFLSLISENSYNRELLFRKDVKIKNFINKNIICLNAYTTLSNASEIILKRSSEILFDPIVVTLNRNFYGICTVDRIIKGINTFFKRELDAVKESQFNLINAKNVLNHKVENELEYTSHLEYIYGPGGDFTQKYEVNEQYSLFTLIDVCGKGVKASSMVFIFGTLFNKIVQKLRRINFTIHSFHKEILNLNHEIFYSKATELYATGVIGLIDKINKILVLYDFGHNLFWIIRNKKFNEKKVYKIEAKQSNLTFLSAFPEIQIKPMFIKLHKDDLIFTCSDGITEQTNYEKQMFIEIISKSLEQFDHNLEKNKNLLLSNWNSFRNNRIIRDDVSFLIVKIS